MAYGVQIKMWGTVLHNFFGYSPLKNLALVRFDKTKEGTQWYSGAEELLSAIPGAKIGDRVILEYITTPRSGLWQARLPKPGEIDEFSS